MRNAGKYSGNYPAFRTTPEHVSDFGESWESGRDTLCYNTKMLPTVVCSQLSYKQTRTHQRTMDDVDNTLPGAFKPEIDYAFEEEMNAAIEWLDDGHLVAQDFMKALADGKELSPPPERPLRVHTFIRTEHDTSYQHEQHPFIAAVYLLSTANEGSDVFLSAPYLTDKHFLDQLAHCRRTWG